MADFLFQLAPVQQRRPRSYGFNANLLNYSIGLATGLVGSLLNT